MAPGREANIANSGKSIDRKNSVGTQNRVRISHGERAIGDRLLRFDYTVMKQSNEFNSPTEPTEIESEVRFKLK